MYLPIPLSEGAKKALDAHFGGEVVSVFDDLAFTEASYGKRHVEVRFADGTTQIVKAKFLPIQLPMGACCDGLRRAMEPCTDNEGYASLMGFDHGRIEFNGNVPDPDYCPWCGEPLPR